MSLDESYPRTQLTTARKAGDLLTVTHRRTAFTGLVAAAVVIWAHGLHTDIGHARTLGGRRGILRTLLSPMLAPSLLVSVLVAPIVALPLDFACGDGDGGRSIRLLVCLAAVKVLEKQGASRLAERGPTFVDWATNIDFAALFSPRGAGPRHGD